MTGDIVNKNYYWRHYDRQQKNWRQMCWRQITTAPYLQVKDWSIYKYYIIMQNLTQTLISVGLYKIVLAFYNICEPGDELLKENRAPKL
jgi:hypothetical protein